MDYDTSMKSCRFFLSDQKSAFCNFWIITLLSAFLCGSVPFVWADESQPWVDPVDWQRADKTLQRIPPNIDKALTDWPPEGQAAYLRFLIVAQRVLDRLYLLNKRIGATDANITLQQLAAMTHEIRLEADRYNQRREPNTDSLYSAQLIQRAVENLQDAVYYWQATDKVRAPYRSTLREKMLDDEVLRVKVKTAVQAVEELKTLQDLAQSVDRHLNN